MRVVLIVTKKRKIFLSSKSSSLCVCLVKGEIRRWIFFWSRCVCVAFVTNQSLATKWAESFFHSFISSTLNDGILRNLTERQVLDAPRKTFPFRLETLGKSESSDPEKQVNFINFRGCVARWGGGGRGERRNGIKQFVVWQKCHLIKWAGGMRNEKNCELGKRNHQRDFPSLSTFRPITVFLCARMGTFFPLCPRRAFFCFLSYHMNFKRDHWAK